MTDNPVLLKKQFPSRGGDHIALVENHEKLTSIFVSVFLWIYISSFSLGHVPWTSLCFAGGLVLLMIGAFRSPVPIPSSVNFAGWTMVIIMFYSLIILGIYIDSMEFLSIPVLSHFILWMIAIWAGGSWSRFMLLYRNLYYIMAVSIIWFLLTLIVKPLLVVNSMFFTENLAGLAGNVNTFSYHLSIAFFLFITPSLCKDGGGDWKKIMLVIFTGFAGILAAERSTVLSWGVALLLLFLYFPVKRTWGVVAVIVLMPLVIFGVGMFRSIGLNEAFTYHDSSLMMRFSEKQGTGENWERMKLQMVGLKLCMEYPMGRFVSDVDWDYYAFENLESIPTINSVASVHNGFLRYFIDFGFPFSIPATAILIITVIWGWRMRNVIREYPIPPEKKVIVLSICGALLSNYVNTMFHNGSIFREKSSTVLFYVFLALAIHCGNFLKTREKENGEKAQNE